MLLKPYSVRLLFSSFVVLVLFCTAKARAVDWNGPESGGEGAWETPGFWEGGVTPSVGDPVVISKGATAVLTTKTGDLGGLTVGNISGETGKFIVRNGGKISNTSGSIGAGATGEVTIDKGGEWTITGVLGLGSGAGASSSQGSLTVDGGLVKVGTNLSLGSGNSTGIDEGTLTVKNGGKVTVGGNLGVVTNLGDTAKGTVLVEGGEVDVTGNLVVNVGASRDSLVKITGGLVSANTVVLGSGGNFTGQATVELDGGVLSTNSVSAGTGAVEGVRSFLINGGALQAQSNDTAEKPFISGFKDGELVLEKGGGTIDAAGHSVKIASQFSGDGGLTLKSDSETPGARGTVTLVVPSIYKGETTVGKDVTLVQGVENALYTKSSVNIQKGGIYDLGGHNSTIDKLNGDSGSKITNNGTTTVEFTVGSDNHDGKFAGDIVDGVDAGKVKLIKDGTGTQTILGTNKYSGGTEIKNGTLIGNTNSLQGEIANGSKLEFSQPNNNGTFNGHISGDGSVEINSVDGLVNFAQKQDYKGDTRISGGTLALNAELTNSNIQIDSKGILSGAGTANKNVTNDGALRPWNGGDTIDKNTFHVGGDYAQYSDGQLLIPVASRDNYGKLEVQGEAKLAGTAKVELINGFDPPSGMKMNILTADGGIDGKLVPAGDYTGDLRLSLDYEDGKKVWAIFEHTGFHGDTPAEDSVGEALDKVVENAGDKGLFAREKGALSQFIFDMELVPRDQEGRYLQQLIPQQAAGIKDIAFNATNMQYMQITDRLAGVRAGASGVSLSGITSAPMAQQVSAHEQTLQDKDGKTVAVNNSTPENSPWSVFASASGIFSNITSPYDLPRQRVTTGYFSTGADYRFDEHVNAGVYVGYQGIESKYTGSVLRGNGVKFGLYSTAQWNGFYVNAIVGGGSTGYSLHRTINSPYHQWAASSNPSDAELDSLIGAGYEFNLGNWRFGANASLQYTYLGISGFNEAGADTLGVRGGGQGPSSLVSTVGANVSYLWEIAPGYKIIPTIGLSWQHEYLNYGQNISGTFANGSGPSFLFNSANGDRNDAFGTAGVSAQLGNHFGGYVYYTPQFGGRQITSHGVIAGVSYNF